MLTQKSTTIGKINVELIVLSIAESVHLPELQAILIEALLTIR